MTLDTGKCPPWLFKRMVALGRSMVEVIIAEEGADELVSRLSDPVWFQALGTALAFDWNASGLTTILTAALKEVVRGRERELGIAICGGKGKTSRNTPREIEQVSERLSLPFSMAQSLTYNSRMAAKVDSSLVQDGFQIYHHAFFFTRNGAWTVVQQGMNTQSVSARRYHWHSKTIKNLVCEPHTGIASAQRLGTVLDMTSKRSGETRDVSTELVSQSTKQLMKDIQLLATYSTPLTQMALVNVGSKRVKYLTLVHQEFSHHPVEKEDFFASPYLHKILAVVCDRKPETYEKFLATDGVGPKTVRALALVSELIYGAKPSYEDPARYSFAHGGKDATPYPVDRPTYDQTIETMKKYVSKTRIPFLTKRQITQRLGRK